MQILNVPEALEHLPHKLRGTGIEVVLIENEFLFEASKFNLKQYTLLLVLEGQLKVVCNSSDVILQPEEALMIKKNCELQFGNSHTKGSGFRVLMMFFDEPALHYALMPFELTKSGGQLDFFKIEMNPKLKVFSESVLLYYNHHKDDLSWQILLKNKLRELIWIFFHTSSRDTAETFFSARLKSH